ncbi:KCNC4 [Mytilus edulis]|uniref:KCNC4 n=1 Tax=Mytilus edulis TaxID=6550 RepID=A0A8S3T3F2_MYTED|nr:KCNC4 [Mytilus edulis]
MVFGNVGEKKKEIKKGQEKRTPEEERERKEVEKEMGSMEEHEEVSLCDPKENSFFDDIVGFTSAVEPISPLPSDPCNTSPDPVMPSIDVPVTAIPSIDAPIVEPPSLEIPLISTSLCLPLSTQPCQTCSQTQEILSPSDLRQTAAIYTPTPVKKLKLEQMNKSQQSRFFINVGGTRFETSAIVIQSCPGSLLSEMIKEDSIVKPYLFDGRNTYFFRQRCKTFSPHP